MRTPACSMRKSTGASGRSISSIDARPRRPFPPPPAAPEPAHESPPRPPPAWPAQPAHAAPPHPPAPAWRGSDSAHRRAAWCRPPRRATPRPAPLSTCSASFQSCISLGHRGVFQQRAQLRRQRQPQRCRRLRAHAHAEAGLLLRRLGHVQQRHASAALRPLPPPAAGAAASSAKAKPCSRAAA